MDPVDPAVNDIAAVTGTSADQVAAAIESFTTSITNNTNIWGDWVLPSDTTYKITTDSGVSSYNVAKCAHVVSPDIRHYDSELVHGFCNLCGDLVAWEATELPEAVLLVEQRVGALLQKIDGYTTEDYLSVGEVEKTIEDLQEKVDDTKALIALLRKKMTKSILG